MNRRHAQHPESGRIPLRVALLVWDQPNGPSVSLNDEVFGRVMRMDIVPAGAVNPGQPITSEHIQGLRAAVLRGDLARHPYIVVVQGRDQKFYVASRNTTRVLDTQDFETLRGMIATEGVVLSRNDDQLTVFLDLVRNGYDGGTRAHKRRELTQLARLYSGMVISSPASRQP